MASSARFVLVCLVGLAGALLLIGIVSETLIRHIVQILPILLVMGALLRWPRWGANAAIPVFAFWILIAVLVWLFLLGVSKIANGHYTVAEIVATFFMAGFSLLGIVTSVPLGKAQRPTRRALTIGLFAIVQVSAMWLSFLEPIAMR